MFLISTSISELPSNTSSMVQICMDWLKNGFNREFYLPLSSIRKVIHPPLWQMTFEGKKLQDSASNSTLHSRVFRTRQYYAYLQYLHFYVETHCIKMNFWTYSMIMHFEHNKLINPIRKLINTQFIPDQSIKQNVL